jgi:hypothetical protein
MRVYRFLTAEFGLEAIRDRRLKIALIPELNDPFELLVFASRDLETRRKFKDVKDRLATYAGLLCFSGDWQNPVLWSHYAEGHRGLCLGFDVGAELARVTYVRKRLQANLSALSGNGDDASNEMHKMLTTKFCHWRYEKEYRLFVQLKDSGCKLQFVDFCNEIVLKEVIVGHRSNLSRASLNEALGDIASAVTVKKARMAFRTFKVVGQQKKLSW